MRITDEFFEELCELAKKHYAVEVATSSFMADDGEDIELVIFTNKMEFLPTHGWKIQTALQACGIQPKRYPTSTLKNMTPRKT